PHLTGRRCNIPNPWQADSRRGVSAARAAPVTSFQAIADPTRRLNEENSRGGTRECLELRPDRRGHTGRRGGRRAASQKRLWDQNGACPRPSEEGRAQARSPNIRPMRRRSGLLLEPSMEHNENKRDSTICQSNGSFASPAPTLTVSVFYRGPFIPVHWHHLPGVSGPITSQESQFNIPFPHAPDLPAIQVPLSGAEPAHRGWVPGGQCAALAPEATALTCISGASVSGSVGRNHITEEENSRHVAFSSVARLSSYPRHRLHVCPSRTRVLWSSAMGFLRVPIVPGKRLGSSRSVACHFGVEGARVSKTPLLTRGLEVPVRDTGYQAVAGWGAPTNLAPKRGGEEMLSGLAACRKADSQPVPWLHTLFLRQEDLTADPGHEGSLGAGDWVLGGLSAVSHGHAAGSTLISVLWPRKQDPWTVEVSTRTQQRGLDSKVQAYTPDPPTCCLASKPLLGLSGGSALAPRLSCAHLPMSTPTLQVSTVRQACPVPTLPKWFREPGPVPDSGMCAHGALPRTPSQDLRTNLCFSLHAGREQLLPRDVSLQAEFQVKSRKTRQYCQVLFDMKMPPMFFRVQNHKVAMVSFWIYCWGGGGDHVWLDTSSASEDSVAIGGIVKETKPGKILVEDDEGKEHWIPTEDLSVLSPMHLNSAQGVDDMIRLGDLNEAGMVHNLLIRYQQNKIYTYTGSILVAVNPFQMLPLYTLEQVQLYYNRHVGELPPHVFAIADNCYFNMKKNRMDQCCIISGESGAGKTETTKLILQFLATVSGQHSWIEQQVLEANPILEAFGNAKTTRNDNSSRFGKYIDIYFNSSGVIEGARIEQFLLEKSRVCRQAPEERNYHIFYSMLMGMNAEEKKLLSLGMPSEYHYLTMGNCTSFEGHNDAKDYAHVRSAMKILTFSDSENWDISKLLAAILHLGNVKFMASVFENLDSSDVMETPAFPIVMKLLEVKHQELRDCLIRHSIIVRGEVVTSPLNVTQAADRRDAFVKSIYGHLFLWIVKKINSVIFIPPSKDPQNVRRAIGLLDIFGFENFQKNSFEQLCINFANEHLQQFFVQHVFTMEQEEYSSENIPWEYIHYTDNRPTLDLLALKPMSVISLLDEESRFPQGTDFTMLQKLNSVHAKNPAFLQPKNIHDTRFGIAHFAGKVYYQVEGFLEKNRDTLGPDIVMLLRSSKNKFLQEIFKLDSGETKLGHGTSCKAKTGGSLFKSADSSKRPSTLAAQFKQSLDQLMKILTNCQPYFIRCIKPNEYKKPLLFDRELCIQQLRYSGMMETVHIRRSGFPIRYTFEEFSRRFCILLPSIQRRQLQDKFRQMSLRIAEMWLKTDKNWKMGKTKIFLKENEDTLLEIQRSQTLDQAAVSIQKVLRGRKYRKDFLRQKQAALTLQAWWRGVYHRRNFNTILLGFKRLQAVARSHLLAKQYQVMRQRMVHLQALCRGYLVRQQMQAKRRAVVVIQAYARGMTARQNFQRQKANGPLIVSAKEPKGQGAAPPRKRKSIYDTISDTEMVEKVFGFLPSMMGGQEGQTTPTSEDLEEKTLKLPKIDLDTVPVVEELEEDVDGLAEYTFPKFAATFFQKSASHTHIRRPLQYPLLYHEDDEDCSVPGALCFLGALAALAVWTIILRFMGDLPEPVLFAKSNLHGSSMKQQTHDATGEDSSAQPPEHRGPAQRSSRRESKYISSMKLKRSSRITGQVTSQLTIGEEAFESDSPVTDRPMSNLEKLRFIVGYAILRPSLRDEIYCQICKQLSENFKKSSMARGWILLSLCLGCFPPSERFMKYLLNFIDQGPATYGPFCAERLRRTCTNGVRTEPPTWPELQAVKSKKRIPIHVILLTGENLTVMVDSASTSREVCMHIAHKQGLSDYLGFSLQVTVYDKFWSLGSGRDHVMDAIAQCEQLTRERNENERQSPWRVYFRKEFFTPWHDSREDPVSTNLIYHQVIHGVRSGEYSFKKEEELVELLARHCYVQLGASAGSQAVLELLHSCILPKLYRTKAPEKWASLVTAAHKQASYTQSRAKPQTVQEQVVDAACLQWPLLFSQLFEVTTLTGPRLPKTQLVLAVNWKGLFFLDQREKLLLELSFVEVMSLATNREARGGQRLVLSTLHEEDYEFTSPSSVAIAELVALFLEGLKERSMFAMALKDQKATDDPIFLVFKKGDLLVLTKETELPDSEMWVLAKNDRTGKTGLVPVACIYAIPTVTKPSVQLLNLLAMSPEKRKLAVQEGRPAELLPEEEPKEKPYTLEEFSYEYFRTPEKETVSRAMPLARTRGHLWAHSSEPLRQPLLKRVHANAELRDAWTSLELTDQIFTMALQDTALQDEVYCQILKQLTHNSTRYSEEKAWQLLWLCTGLFAPGKALLPHAQKFIDTRRKELLAPDCSRRIQRVLRTGPRKQPPHQVEVEATDQKVSRICHKICLPNDTCEMVEVGSSSRVRDVCESITARLQLASWEGCSLFIKIADKVISQKEGDFFFDSLREISDWVKKNKPQKEGAPVTLPYQVYFMRKLWLAVIPGKDVRADTILHYHQELPKYLRGFHKCSREDAVHLAGLIYKARYDSDRSHLASIPKILRELVPENLTRLMSSEEWKKNILLAVDQHKDRTVEEAKVAFLKWICRWPTFGSAFFEVKQTSEPSYPDIILIAINRHGVLLINPKTKELLTTYPFNKIASWSSGSTYFHMMLGSLGRGSRLLCETSLGYKMDDLITSYVQHLMTTLNKQRGSRALADP
ncbi:Unconventional myosin-VIIb, partial [Galemys pyrenaicus]